MTGCYVVFELGKWRFQEVPIDVPFYRLGKSSAIIFRLEITILAANGPFAIAVFIVQILCGIYQRFLLSVTILQTILCALALFTLSSSITNVYFIVSFFVE